MTDREKALAYFRHREAQVPMPGARAMYQEAIKALEQPTVEPERKKGKWIAVDDYFNRISGRCSACGWEAHMYEDDVVGMNYCPNCGADMRGDKDDQR